MVPPDLVVPGRRGLAVSVAGAPSFEPTPPKAPSLQEIVVSLRECPFSATEKRRGLRIDYRRNLTRVSRLVRQKKYMWCGICLSLGTVGQGTLAGLV